MCSGFEAGSYFRLIDFVYHSTLGVRVKKKQRRSPRTEDGSSGAGGKRGENERDDKSLQ
jgi:hypothetical protein